MTNKLKSNELDKWIVEEFYPSFISQRFSTNRNENEKVKFYVRLAVASIRKRLDEEYSKESLKTYLENVNV